ncbi:MAG: hypothetical protein 2 [Bactrocera zonata toti-like virus]|nr:MAG: hypothetical protein 2 [Bactrocera zonata toti-like virus]
MAEVGLPVKVQRVYASIVDNKFLSAIDFVTTGLRRRPRKLDSLSRFRVSAPSHWPCDPGVSCCSPLYVYYRILKKSGQTNSAFDLVHLLRYIRSAWKRLKYMIETEEFVDLSEYQDDFYRHALKSVSSYCYNLVFERGPVYMLFTHLHSLTGKCPFTIQQILDDIDGWVSNINHSTGKPKSLHMPTVNEVLDEAFLNWRRGNKYGHMSFKDFCNDFLRHGTNGGAPKVDLYGSQYRTKWAWSVYHSTTKDGKLKKDRDLYEQSKRESQTAGVALKEEAAKTREVITTPMSSYLRQSYLWYRWGKPNIPSPISRSGWVNEFEETEATWYGCIDGERFDHSIPKDVILNVIRRFGALDEETRRVAEEEIAHLEHLEVRWGERTWKWQGGLLSGWRFTSILGSLISLAASRYILKHANKHATNVGVMGDDLVLYSHVETIDKQELVRLYNEFGLQSNPKKTVEGRTGEFLRKVRGVGGSWGFPALALRTLMYANPWVSKYTYEREEEVSGGWMGVMSRFIPHSVDVLGLKETIFQLASSNLTQLFGQKQWNEWLHTPLSAGGGGALESSDPHTWYNLRRMKKMSTLGSRWVIPTILGITKRKVVQVTNPIIQLVDLDEARRNVKKLKTGISRVPCLFRDDVSKTDCIFGIQNGELSRTEINSYLTSPLPSGMRLASRTRIIEYLLVPTSGMVCNSSIFHTKESVAATGKLSRFLTQSYLSKNTRATNEKIKVATTLMYSHMFGRVSRCYGTW